MRHGSACLCISQSDTLGRLHASRALSPPALGQHQAALCSRGTGSASTQLCDVAGPAAWGDRTAGWTLASASMLGGLRLKCRCLIVGALQRNTALLCEHLCCGLISSVGFPPASSPLPPILWTARTSVILPASEDSAKTLRRMKTIVLVCFEETQPATQTGFFPSTEAGLTVQADRLPPPAPPPLVPSNRK